MLKNELIGQCHCIALDRFLFSDALIELDWMILLLLIPMA